MTHETSQQPGLQELLARYLNQQAQAVGAGLAITSGEVTPYDVSPLPAVDAAAVWNDAVAVAPFFQAGVDTKTWRTPPHWVSLATGQEPIVAAAFCLANFPQLVRDFHFLLHTRALADFLPVAQRALPAPTLLPWGNQAARDRAFPDMLLAVGSLRLARHFDEANSFVKSNDAAIAPSWRAAWTNEKAALLWHQGQLEPARALWESMEPSAPVLFNRGMAELFAGNPARGEAALTKAIALIPEASAWHHLARVYLLLATR